VDSKAELKRTLSQLGIRQPIHPPKWTRQIFTSLQAAAYFREFSPDKNNFHADSGNWLE
jgi:hypothetical protein